MKAGEDGERDDGGEMVKKNEEGAELLNEDANGGEVADMVKKKNPSFLLLFCFFMELGFGFFIQNFF